MSLNEYKAAWRKRMQNSGIAELIAAGFIYNG